MRADLMTWAVSWMLTYALHSSLLLGGAWLASRRLVRGSAARDLLWKAALIGGLVTATIQVGLGFQSLSGALAIRMSPVEAAPPARAALAPAATAEAGWQGLLPSGGAPEKAAPLPRAERPPSPILPKPASLVAAAPAESPALLPDWILPAGIALWASLALVLSALYVGQRLRALSRIGPRRQISDGRLLDMLDALRRGAGIRRIVRLTAAPGLTSPVALGHNEIALPEAALTELDPEQQRSMLAHELAHLERHDPAWLTVGCVLERVFFFQPLNRRARVAIQEAAEYLCDDWAVHRTGSGVSLATCLVKVAEWVDTPNPIPLAGMAERRSQLVTRIHRLIEGRVMPASPRSIWLLAGLVAIVGITALAAPGVTAATLQQAVQDTSKAKAPSADSTASDTTSRTWLRGEINANMRAEMARARLDIRRATLEAEKGAMSGQMRALRAQLDAERTLSPAPVAAIAPKVEAELARANAVLAGAMARAPRPPRPPRPPRWRHNRQGDSTSIAVPALIAALKDNDVEVRRAAVQSLSNFDDPRAIPGFIDALHDSDPEVRGSAASALGSFEDRRAIPGLIGLLKDQNKDVREAALSSLGSFPGEIPVEALVQALGDPDPEVRAAALGLASRRSDDDKPADPQVVQAVTNLIADPNADVRSEAAEALSSLNLKEAPAGLLAAAKDKNPDVRQHVAEALGAIRDPRAVPSLRDLIQDSNADVRESAVNALGEIRDRAALEALVGALKSPDAAVRRQAAEELGQRDEE